MLDSEVKLTIGFYVCVGAPTESASGYERGFLICY